MIPSKGVIREENEIRKEKERVLEYMCVMWLNKNKKKTPTLSFSVGTVPVLQIEGSLKEHPFYAQINTSILSQWNIFHIPS